jgi:hypothetical protein
VPRLRRSSGSTSLRSSIGTSVTLSAKSAVRAALSSGSSSARLIRIRRSRWRQRRETADHRGEMDGRNSYSAGTRQVPHQVPLRDVPVALPKARDLAGSWGEGVPEPQTLAKGARVTRLERIRARLKGYGEAEEDGCPVCEGPALALAPRSEADLRCGLTESYESVVSSEDVRLLLDVAEAAKAVVAEELERDDLAAALARLEEA